MGGRYLCMCIPHGLSAFKSLTSRLKAWSQSYCFASVMLPCLYLATCLHQASLLLLNCFACVMLLGFCHIALYLSCCLASILLPCLYHAAVSLGVCFTVDLLY